MGILLGPGVVGCFFTLMWSALYPEKLLEVVTFRDKKEWKASIFFNVYIFASVIFVIVGLNGIYA